MQTSTPDRIRATVRHAYGAIASKRQQGRLRRGSHVLRPDRANSTRLGYSPGTGAAQAVASALIEAVSPSDAAASAAATRT